VRPAKSDRQRVLFSFLRRLVPFAETSYDQGMKFGRSSGILLHPTSLPGRFGAGDLGPEAYRFTDFLAGAGQQRSRSQTSKVESNTQAAFAEVPTRCPLIIPPFERSLKPR
jgi:hypothetical protein